METNLVEVIYCVHVNGMEHRVPISIRNVKPQNLENHIKTKAKERLAQVFPDKGKDEIAHMVTAGYWQGEMWRDG